VNLEKVATPPPPPSPPPAQSSRPAPAPERPHRVNRPAGSDRSDKSDKSDRSDAPAGDASDTAGDDASDRPEPRSDGRARPLGVLVLGSKPPCDIAIDGVATTLHTPQKEIKLSVGRHRITLTNTEFGINETFTVDIKPDVPEKLIKDYSDRLPN